MNDAFERLTPKFMALLYDLEKLFDVNKKGIKDWVVFQVVKAMRSDAWDLGIKLYEKLPYDRSIMLKKIDQEAGENAANLLKGRFLIPAH